MVKDELLENEVNNWFVYINELSLIKTRERIVIDYKGVEQNE